MAMFSLDQIIEIKFFKMINKYFFAPPNYFENAFDIMKNTDFGTFTKSLANLYFDWAMQKNKFYIILKNSISII
jgi:hypothetical protein